MALGPRLDLRQSQSLVMTPQLQQAIRLLALSNLELESFIAEAVSDNPLVDLANGEGERAAPAESGEIAEAVPGESTVEGHGDGEAALDIAGEMLDRDFDTGSSRGSGAGGGEDMPDIGERASGEETLAEYLHAQLGAAGGTEVHQFIARQIIDQLDEAGYLTIELAEIADLLGIPMDQAEAGLALVQSLDPTGVGARSLSECLALQAKEADRYDPCMEVLIDNLELVAKGAVAHLKRICVAKTQGR